VSAPTDQHPADDTLTPGELLCRVAEQVRAYHGDGPDPLLTALAQARRQHDQARQRLRLLLAYGREFTKPRPYRLVDLARAAGLSKSGVRIAYDEHDIAVVGQRIHQ
jgi:hypothetical protein